MDEGLIAGMAGIFSEIWNGLSNTNVPGTDWPFSGLLIAIFTAGFIGKILKAFFDVFNSHFDSGRPSGKPDTQRKNYNKKWSDLKND